ncbi:MAG TPA: hypothetical protein PLV56_09980, partial [Synergistales bacterium]|nr:hypothetical protein [Synergistales bacterium]
GGIGTFSSEIGPSALFTAYQMVKDMEGRGIDRKEILEKLMENYGENNPATGVIAGNFQKEV